MVRLTIYFICVSLIFSSCSVNYYFVRHAEKADQTADPPLSEAGRIRTEDLKSKLKNKKLDAILVTKYLRTQQTAEPIAATKNIALTITNASADSVVQRIKKLPGKNILVVGHSNTIPQIVSELAITHVDTIYDGDYDNFYIVKKGSFFKKKPRLIQTNYGRRTPNN